MIDCSHAAAALLQGLSKRLSRLHFSRWCPFEPANVHNLVLSTLEEAERLEGVGGGFQIANGTVEGGRRGNKYIFF